MCIKLFAFINFNKITAGGNAFIRYKINVRVYISCM